RSYSGSRPARNWSRTSASLTSRIACRRPTPLLFRRPAVEYTLVIGFYRGQNMHRGFCCAVVIICVPAVVAQELKEPPFVATSPWRSPADEAKSFKLPPGFQIQLVACEPDIQKPLNIAFDAKGRLWVSDTVEYPYAAPPGRKARDTIKILSDFGPDGKARKIETFADDMNIPIGVLPDLDGNGCIAFSIPNLYHLRKKGAGEGISKDRLYGSIGQRDTHGLTNSFTRGFDGWVYCCHGFSNDSTLTGRDGSKLQMNSGNIYRIKPDGS